MAPFDKILIRVAAISLLVWILWSFLGGPTWIGLLINANQRATVAEQRVEMLQKELAKKGKPDG